MQKSALLAAIQKEINNHDASSDAGRTSFGCL